MNINKYIYIYTYTCAFTFRERILSCTPCTFGRSGSFSVNRALVYLQLSLVAPITGWGLSQYMSALIPEPLNPK